MSKKHDHSQVDEKEQVKQETAAEETAEKNSGWEEAKTEETPETKPAPELSEADKLKAEMAELQAKYLYLQAEYQNYRKRAARDLSDLRIHTIADTLTPFLAVADFLAMADTAAEKSDNLEALKQGLRMIIGEFTKALDELGVKKLKTVGEKFDPALHDAAGQEPSETVAEGVVIREWAGGFKLGEKLLRPARVIVSSGKAAEKEEKAAEETKPAEDAK